MLGPYIKSRGTRGTENVSKCSPHHNGDICTRGNNLKTSFSHRSQNVKKKVYILGCFGGPEGVFNDRTLPILLSSYPLTHIDSIPVSQDTMIDEQSQRVDTTTH